MPSDIENLLGDFGYPEEIIYHLEEIRKTVLEIVPANAIYSILLLGSTARGELSYRFDDGKLDIFSDYEFIIVSNKKISNGILSRLDDALENLSTNWDIQSPFFHIDYGIATVRKFKLTPPTFWAFEVKSASIPIFGADARELLKPITLANLDTGNLNELILVRLWNMLLQVNPSIIQGFSETYEEECVKIAYSRNALEVVSIYLPNQSVLLPGYRSRISAFNSLGGKSPFSEISELLAKATKQKIDCSASYLTLEEAQFTFLEGIQLLILHLGEYKDKDSFVNGSEPENHALKKALQEKSVRKLRRKFLETKTFAKHYSYSISKIGILFQDKIRIPLIKTMLNMHLALKHGISDEDRDHFLQAALNEFASLSLTPRTHFEREMTFSGKWNSLTSELVGLMGIWFYGRLRENMLQIEAKIHWEDK